MQAWNSRKDSENAFCILFPQLPETGEDVHGNATDPTGPGKLETESTFGEAGSVKWTELSTEM